MNRHRQINIAVLLLSLTALLPLGAAETANFPAAPTAPEPSAPAAAPLVMHFYFTPTCPLCEPAKRQVAALEKTLGDRLKIIRHDHSAAESIFNSMLLALDAYGVESTPTQALFFGDVCLDGEQINDGTTLVLAVEKALASGAVTRDFSAFGADAGLASGAATTAENATAPSANGAANNSAPAPLTAPELAKLTAEIRAKRMSLGIVLATGFADGFNPCAFATVILFVSMLTTAGRERRMILAIGIAFIVGVFLTYLALGVAFYQIIGYFERSASLRFVSLAIKWLALIMVALSAVLSTVDAVRAWRSGGTGKMLLVLPDGLKNRIRKKLRGAAYGGSVLVGAFITGVVISLLEAACTGQTYLPVITGLLNEDAQRGYGLLLLYNTMFILPLIAVFLLAFFGLTGEQIGNLARKKVWLTKAALALVFLAMTIWLGSLLLPTLQLTTG
jgi:hypothetical protein